MSYSSIRRQRVAALAFAAFVAGCSSTDSTSGPLPTNEGVGTTVAGDPPSEAPAERARTETEAAAEISVNPADEPEDDPAGPAVVGPDDARALITPTGVVVPVTDYGDAGYEIVTPCGVPGLVSWGTPIEAVQIVLDPGHGGEIETGAVGPNGLVERDINLTLAKRTANELTDRGISVVLTRTSDYRVPLAVRSEIANRLDAEAIISIHHNAPEASSSDVPGTEIFIQSGNDESRRLGGTIYEAVVDALDEFDVDWQAAPDAGVLRVITGEGNDSYGMVRRPEMPAVLLEYGYLANPAEAELFATEEYAEAASVALADGIEAWLDSDAPGEGFVDEPRVFTPNGRTGGTAGCVDPELE